MPEAREQLRAYDCVRNTYCVCEKTPPTYEYRWKLHVLWTDGGTDDFESSDYLNGDQAVYEQAILAARRRGGTKNQETPQ